MQHSFKKCSSLIKRSNLAILLGTVAATLGGAAHASCTYTVTNNWGTGYTAAVRVTNDTNARVNGWQVNWSYAKNTVTNAWNAQLSGNYTATNLGWNGGLNPGQSAEFGFQAVTNGGAVETPVLSGNLCGASVSSVSVSSRSVASSVVSSNLVSSSRVSSSVASSIIRSSSSVSSVTPIANNIATLATATTSYVSPWETLAAVNDNSVPANSNDKSKGAYGNWDNPNSR